MNKHYFVNGVSLATAADAMAAHRKGKDVSVLYNNGHTVTIHGAPRKERNADDDNRRHCKHIAKEIEAYTDGNVYHCPECGEEIRMPDSVGDKFKCPHCGEVNDTSDYEQLSVWDFLNDVYDIEYRCSSNKEYRSVRIMVACGGPNIYIDTADALVKLYWWNERAEYPLSYDARDAIDEWAEEYWNI